MEPQIGDPAAGAPDRQHVRLSLRARLMMLVVASVVPVVVLTLVRGYFDYQDDVANSGRKTLELARSMSLGVEKELQGRIAVLQALAHSQSLRDGNLDRFRAQVEAVITEQFPGSNVLLLREDGQQVMNTLLQQGAPLPVRPTLDTVRAVFATGRPAVSSIYMSLVAGRHVVSIDVPVRRADGSVVYALSMNPQVDAFAEVIRRQRLPESWVISIFDRQGANVARSLSPEKYVGQKAGSALLPLLLSEREGILTSTSRDGIRLVSSFSRVELAGWAVSMGVPLAELTAPAVGAAMRTLGVGGAVLAIGLGLAMIVTRQITRPMALLQRLAADRDEVLNPPPTGLKEADEVVQALTAAEQHRRRSEAEVRERNEQLVASNNALAAEIDVRERAERKAQAQLERLNLLHQITRAIGERQDLNSIFQVVVRSLEDQLPVDFACLCLYDAVDQALTVARVGTKSEALAADLAMPERARIDIDQNGLSQCVRGHLVYEPDIARVDFPFPRRVAGGGLRALVVAPLQFESRVFGVLVVARVREESFSSGECEFLKQLSEHVALAAHQAQLYVALQQAYDDLRQTQQAVMQQERLRALGQMASGIAHDINNALSPVALYTESLLETDTSLSPRTRSYLETIQRAVDDVAQTVARMREFYRQREPQLALVSVALNQLVKQVVDLTRARWSDMPMQRGVVVQVRTEGPADLPPVMGVESEIREALINLILNAVDALPSGGTVTLRTKVAADDAGSGAGLVLVEVTDDGHGMDEETRRRCLEPFFTTKGERGTGLGLAMVYGVMRRHNADIDVESEAGRGTTIRLSFPIAPSAAAPTGTAYTGPAVPPRLRVLLVDDDPMLLKSLQDILEADGHIAEAANGGHAGIAAFRAACDRGEPYAAVITDLGMPNVDGRRVASAVKEASPTTPVILLTGWGQRLLSDEDVPQHVDRVLSKPPKLRDLRDALAQCCRTAPAADSRAAD
jgi:signal transduction histidine kinase/CheY-like chemotaxis protein